MITVAYGFSRGLFFFFFFFLWWKELSVFREMFGGRSHQIGI